VRARSRCRAVAFLPTTSTHRTQRTHRVLPCPLPAGSAVMSKVLDTAVPRFLQQLAVDYAAWAAGDDSREPVSSGGLSLVPEDGLEGVQGPSPDDEQGWD